MTTKNHDILTREVAAHIAADALVKGQYWKGGDTAESGKGCFIACLTHGRDPKIAFDRFGIPVAVQRIAESIFENLPDDEGRAFFAALPGAIGCNGKDLSRVHWRFLAEELRELPKVPSHIQAVIDPVIQGMDLLASGNEWPRAAARAASYAAAGAAGARAAAGAAADAAADAADTARAVGTVAARAAARAASAATYAALYASALASGDAARAAARIRQRDTLLRLIADAPVVDAA